MTFGEPGGIFLQDGLDLDRGEYVVTNEDGAEVDAFPHELDARQFCENMIASGV